MPTKERAVHVFPSGELIAAVPDDGPAELDTQITLLQAGVFHSRDDGSVIEFHVCPSADHAPVAEDAVVASKMIQTLPAVYQTGVPQT